MAQYGGKAQRKVARVMHEQKAGKLRSGSGRKVTSRKQAVAIGLAEARREGDKVPSKKAKPATTGTRGTRKSTTRKRSS